MHTFKRTLVTFAAGFVAALVCVFGFGDRIGSQLEWAGAKLGNAAQPTLVDANFIPELAYEAPPLAKPVARKVKEARR